MDEIKKIWAEYSGEPQALKLPSAPKQFIHYFEEDNMPPAKLFCFFVGCLVVFLDRIYVPLHSHFGSVVAVRHNR